MSFDPVSEPVLAAQWWALFAEAARLAGADDERGHRLKRAADLLTGTASSALTATVRADLARFTILRGDPVTGLAEARAALAIATAVHDAAAEAASLSAIATAQPFVDQDPVSTYWAAISRADDAGADVVLHQCYVNLTDAFLRDGRYAECVSAAARGVDALTRRGLLQPCGGTLLGNAAQAMISTGDWASAEVALDRATELEDNAPIKRFLDELRATLLLRRGETSTAMAVLAETTGEVERTARPDDLIRRRTVTAQALLQSTRHLDALEEVLRGLTVVSDSIAWEAAAQLCAIGRQSLVALDQERRSAGKPRDSDQTSISRQQAAEQLLDDVIRLIEPTPGSPAESWLRLAEAERTRVTGPPQPHLWADLVQRWSTLRSPYEQYYSLLRQAESLLLLGGHRDLASQLLDDASHAVAQLGANGLAAEVRALRQMAGLTPQTAEATGLTRREQEVLNLLAAGSTNKQIGQCPVHQRENRKRACIQFASQDGSHLTSRSGRDRSSPPTLTPRLTDRATPARQDRAAGVSRGPPPPPDPSSPPRVDGHQVITRTARGGASTPTARSYPMPPKAIRGGGGTTCRNWSSSKWPPHLV